jgi:hypothetical protein
VDLGIVPGAQQSPEISNWLQDEIIARTKECSTTGGLQVDDKMLGMFYHQKLYRGQHVYMVHAKNATVCIQEMVASTLLDYKIPMVWLDWATIRFRFFGPASRYTGSFCVFGPVLSSPAHGTSSLAMEQI